MFAEDRCPLRTMIGVKNEGTFYPFAFLNCKVCIKDLWVLFKDLLLVAPAEREADHKFGCKICLNPTLDVASFKLKVF